MSIFSAAWLAAFEECLLAPHPSPPPICIPSLARLVGSRLGPPLEASCWKVRPFGDLGVSFMVLLPWDGPSDWTRSEGNLA